MNLKMSWTLNGTGGNKQIQSWNTILDQLKKLQGKEGVLTLDVLDNVNNCAEMLQVRAENGFYVIMLGEIFEDEYRVRTYWASSNEPNDTATEMSILGDHWPKRQLIKNFDLVINIFKEFFDTGTISTDTLN